MRRRRLARLGAALCALATSACGMFASAPPQPPVLDPDRVQRGALLFLDPRLSGDGRRACATCHPGGGSDDRFWRDGVEVEAGAEGARRTLSLRGAWATAPYLWDGSIGELDAVVDRMLRVEMNGATLPPIDRAALLDYVRSIPPFDRGRVQPDGAPVEPATLSARRGFEVYVNAECDVCHPPPLYTRSLRFDVGTGGKFGIPTLRELGTRSGPFGHDGRWPTLEVAVEAILRAREVELDADERARLLAYLKLL